MTTEHTQGPWTINGQSIDGPRADKCRRIVATVNGLDEMAANAALIASAPDLLAALESALSADQDSALWRTDARAAIAKAKGGQ